MNFQEILNDKSLKSKQKTEAISEWLLQHPDELNSLLNFARDAKDSNKATCIEAIEFATQKEVSIANMECLDFVTTTLSAKAPRVKWESAKVIGNIARCFPDHLDEAIKGLLNNTEYDGTVVRWSAAFALSQILILKTKRNKDLLPAIESICQQEEKNSIKKIYVDAMKKVKK